MKEFNLQGTKRTEVGKKSSRELRKQGIIPCVIYGSKKDAEGNTIATNFTVPFEGLRKLIYTPDIFIVNVDVDGEKSKAVLREIQFHPVSDSVLHVDFYQVTEGKPITMNVPVVFDGHAQGVRVGGVFYPHIRSLKVSGEYQDIPEKLHIDITDLALDKSIKIGDLNFDKLELLSPKQTLVCTVRTTRAVADDSATAETAEAAPAAAEAAPAAEAKEPAKGDAGKK